MLTVIHGPEHFFAGNSKLTCVVSPVLDHEDRLVGVIDASSDCHSRQMHTVALSTIYRELRRVGIERRKSPSSCSGSPN